MYNQELKLIPDLTYKYRFGWEIVKKDGEKFDCKKCNTKDIITTFYYCPSNEAYFCEECSDRKSEDEKEPLTEKGFDCRRYLIGVKPHEHFRIIQVSIKTSHKKEDRITKREY